MELKNTSKNFDIKLDDHFKLYIPFKDTIVFENELLNNGIRFYTELNEQPLTEHGYRYFLLTKDRKIIDEIIKKNQISTNVESSLLIDFEDNNTLMKVSLFVVLILIGLFLVLYVFGWLS